jgi:hypothetical protein
MRQVAAHNCLRDLNWFARHIVRPNNKIRSIFSP